MSIVERGQFGHPQQAFVERRQSVLELPSVQEQIAEQERFLGVNREQLAEGRRRLTLRIGPMKVTALEIPAEVLSDEESALIALTRESYAANLGNDLREVLKEEATDGGKNSPYRTLHYIGKVEVTGEEPRYISKKKVYIREEAAEVSPAHVDNLILDDIAYYRVRDLETGDVHSLWQELQSYFKRSSDLAQGDPRLRIPANQRTGTYPYNLKPKHEMEREKMPVGWAAMELLIADNPDDIFIACQLCQEFQDVVQTVTSDTGEVTTLEFTKTAAALNFLDSKTVELDSRNTDVRLLKLNAPGYWIDNAGAASYVKELISEQRMSLKDFLPICSQMYEDLGRDGSGLERLHKDMQRFGLDEPNGSELILFRTFADKDQEIRYAQNLADMLTSFRYFKYLVPTLKRSDKINEQLSAREFREGMLSKSGDGPFSSLLTPHQWRLSNLNLLAEAKKKYES